MDLEQYKKAWDSQPEETQKVSKADIYKMAQANSSSIVRWIFIIGILEFVILTGVGFFINTDDDATMKLDVDKYIIPIQIVSYIITVYFIIKFYLNYKSISVVDNTKTLMDKIMKTRKTVKQYVFLALFLGFVVFLIISSSMIYNMVEVDHLENNKVIPMVILLGVVGIFILLFFWAFYQLLYGILLRKLNRNYKELAKLDE